jgi:hypothetical protein
MPERLELADEAEAKLKEDLRKTKESEDEALAVTAVAAAAKAEAKGNEIMGIQLDIGRAFIDSSHVLGKGSFVDVFRGTYRFSGHQLDKGVAIKTFRGAQNLTPSMRKKIEEEVVVWTRLSHPNLVRLYGILTDPSHGPCLVLELCVASLRSLLNQAHEGQMKIPWNIRGKWLMEVACGMTELHSLSPQSIIHRDCTHVQI